jgi:hypothetical protein
MNSKPNSVLVRVEFSDCFVGGLQLGFSRLFFDGCKQIFLGLKVVIGMVF